MYEILNIPRSTNALSALLSIKSFWKWVDVMNAYTLGSSVSGSISYITNNASSSIVMYRCSFPTSYVRTDHTV